MAEPTTQTAGVTLLTMAALTGAGIDTALVAGGAIGALTAVSMLNAVPMEGNGTKAVLWHVLKLMGASILFTLIAVVASVAVLQGVSAQFPQFKDLADAPACRMGAAFAVGAFAHVILPMIKRKIARLKQ